MSLIQFNSHLSNLVEQLPEIYQPIYEHPEFSERASRRSDNRWKDIRHIYAAIKKNLGRPLRVLDLGCAQGYFSMQLAKLGASVEGIDYQADNIAVCQTLAEEHPDFNVHFRVERIEDVLGKISTNQYDIVLCLSVFHHLIHDYGIEKVKTLLTELALKVECAIFEIALASEPPYWAASQPQNPRVTLQGFSFVHEVSRHATHLSEIKRPLYFASNHYWYLGGHAEPFENWTYTSHHLVQNNFQQSRKYFIGKKHIAKLFTLETLPHLQNANKKEVRKEASFLRNHPSGFYTPKIITAGENATEMWLVRELLPGDILSKYISSKWEYNNLQIIEDVLDQLCILETKKLFHNDLRTWNVLVNPDGRANLIDYGDISNKKQDVVWPYNLFLAFWIFVYEVATGTQEPPFPQRQPFISPFNLPMPFRQWAMSVWVYPTDQWSFKLLRDEFQKMKKNIIKKTVNRKKVTSAPESSTMLWMRAMEEHFGTLNIALREIETKSQEIEKNIVQSNVLKTELDNVRLEKEQIRIKLDQVWAEKEQIQAERDQFLNQRDQVWAEKEQIQAERDTLRMDINTLRADRDRIQAEREHFYEEMRSATIERDQLQLTLNSVVYSRSWKFTHPLRVVMGIALRAKSRLFQPKVVPGKVSLPIRLIRWLLRGSFKFFLSHPRLKKQASALLGLFPRLKTRLRQTESYEIADIQVKALRANVKKLTSSEDVSNAEDFNFDENHQYQPTPPVVFPLPKGERIIYYYVDHTIQCPSNTGMQQVTRRLGRALLEAGEKVCFVKWDAHNHQFTMLDQDELTYLSQWHGPTLSPQVLAQYPKPGDNTIPLRKHELAAGHWLVVPEVTHITYQAQPMTLDVLVEAKRQGLKTAFVYYDATPLSRADLNEMTSNHETYMQQLLLSDLVVPISNWSARELASFFQVHEGAVLTPTPRIAALPLPGESQLASRVKTPVPLNGTSKLILSVGSIVPHKNQVQLVHAFERYCESYPETNWQLLLAGNLHPDLIDEIKRATEQNSRIKLLGYISNDKLDELYRSCSFTVFPSVSEGFGLPILESLWYAKPCVCANFGAMGEAAQGGGCLAIDTRDADELLSAITRMTTEPGLLGRLSLEASMRPITVWADYAQRFVELLNETSDPIKMQMGVIYYWVDHTVTFPRNTGIQRVVRGLARALLENGFKVIPVKWDKACNQFYSPSEKELDYLSRWNGPQPSDWSAWIDPVHATPHDWVLIPELVSDPAVNLKTVKSYATKNKLRCAWVFYDTIPWKMKADYPVPASDAHRKYMENLNEFELIFPISQFSRSDLISFLATLPWNTPNLENRIQTCVLPGEFLESKRSTNIKQKDIDTVKILCVGTLEPRKNHSILLQAFSQVAAQAHRPVELIIAGSGPYPDIVAQVKRYINTIPGIRWEKDISDAKLRELYTSCDFTVYPSLEEGFGLPILESLWYARPCICRNSGAMAEVAKEGGCLMVETTDPNTLANAMLEMVKNDMLRQELAQEAAGRPFKTWRNYAREVVTRMATERYIPLRQSLPEPMDRTDFYNHFVNLRPRPLLSICISTYNRAEWLAVNLENLTRILPNPHTEIEIVVCDNTSSDHTPDVVKPYQQRADFRYYRNPTNVGMLGNLRVTAHHARGRYIWILGDDDLIKPGGIEKILQVIQTHPDIALVYLNYAYTRQDDAKEVTDLDLFLNESTPIVSPGMDIVGPVSRISTQSENFFTAIYCLVFRRDHALRAYTQNTEGRPFSTMLSCIPTTYYTLNFMMNEPAYWVGEPQLVVNMNVSWMKYAPIWILERLPEAHELAEKMGADPIEIDRCRNKHVPHVMFWFRDIYHHDEESNMTYFSPSRLITRIKHLDSFVGQVESLRTFYEHVYANWGNPGAKIPPSQIFPSFEKNKAAESK